MQKMKKKKLCMPTGYPPHPFSMQEPSSNPMDKTKDRGILSHPYAPRGFHLGQMRPRAFFDTSFFPKLLPIG